MPQRLRVLSTSSGLSAVSIVAAIITIVSVTLPWYSVNLARPGLTGATSGWDSTNIARYVVVLAAIWGVGAVLLLADDLNRIQIDYITSQRIAWGMCAMSILAVALTLVRLARPPHPADLLSRDIGLFIAIAGTLLAAWAALWQARRR